MKYIIDSMLNGLAKYLTKPEIDAVTATFAIRKDNDSSKEIPDAKIFRFVLEKKYRLIPAEKPEDYAIITSDKELVKYCKEFGISCKHVKKPATRKDFKETASKLIGELRNSRSSQS